MTDTEAEALVFWEEHLGLELTADDVFEWVDDLILDHFKEGQADGS